jgi:hypothetical protein
MECELEVIGFDNLILFFQLLHRLYYFVNSYNCYHRAYSVKCCPDYAAPIRYWIISTFQPFLKLLVGPSRECGHQKAPAGDREYSIA